MTALAQGSAGLALVMGFALLCVGRFGEAAILLAVQSGAAAVTALAVYRPLMALPPVLLGFGIWLIRYRTTPAELQTAPKGGAGLGIGIGAVLAVLCQSQGGAALPLAILLLAILLAATRLDRWLQLVSLVAAQNAVALAGSLGPAPSELPAVLLAPLCCLLLPLPLAAGLTLPYRQWAPRHWAPPLVVMWLTRLKRTAAWVGWLDLVLALAMFAATLLVPLDALAAVFAPLFGLDGVLRACARWQRRGMRGVSRVAALVQAGCTILAVCAPDPITAWLAVLAGMAMALLPVLSRRRGAAVLGFLGAGVALFGLLPLPGGAPLLGYFCLFVGFAVIAAVVPELAPVLVVLLLRLVGQSPWPFGAETLGAAIAVAALLSCAALLTLRPRRTSVPPGAIRPPPPADAIHPAPETLAVSPLEVSPVAIAPVAVSPIPSRRASLRARMGGTLPPHRTTLLVVSQASIAALCLCLGQPEGRFAALVLLILLILCRSAARIAGGWEAALAIAGLAGIPPLGVFPGLVLVVLALSAHEPWLLLPVGAALIALTLAAMPRQMSGISLRSSLGPVAWLPLALSMLAGYAAPDQLVHWWRLLTAGRT